MIPLSERERFKRRLVQGAVDDNLEQLTGELAGSRQRRRAERWGVVRRLGVVALTVVAVAVAAAFWLGRPDATASAPTPAPIVIAALLPEAEPSAAEGDLSPTERLVASLHDGAPDALLGDVIPLAIGRVAIDPGHGGRDVGTSLGFGLLEKDLTRDIADRLAQRLTAASVATVITRHDDETVSLKRRADIANQAKADLFISIHVNWLPNRQASGVETFYLGTTDDPLVSRIAAAENQDSGYAMADYRHLLEGIFADVRQAESRRLARATQAALFATLRGEHPEIVSRGVLTAPFVVLVATEMPAILAEVACLSNDIEARLLAMPSYRQRIADALFAGIISYASSVGHGVDEAQRGQLGRSSDDQGTHQGHPEGHPEGREAVG